MYLISLQMLKSCKASEKETVFSLADKLNVTLSAPDKALEGKSLMRCVMKKWLPASEAMLGMIIKHLPSPDVAQTYRTETLYEGPLDDPVALGTKSFLKLKQEKCTV